MIGKVGTQNNNRELNIGILTLYYKSNNYGGLLQSYALTKIINDQGFNAKQIKYMYNTKKTKMYNELFNYYNLIDIIKILLERFKINRTKKVDASELFEQRIKKAREFAESIPHSESIYSDKNIEDLLDKFDIFVVGSDQIWNEFRSTFFLTFAPQNYGKIAYAASMSKPGLSEKKIKYMSNFINRFDYVSVRENSAKDSLEPFVNKDIQVLLDPTFLLNKKDWYESAKDYKIDSKYMFVYLLGDSIEHRKRIKKIANMFNLAIVFIPHVHLSVREADKNFADFDIVDAGPEEFVGLIKNAEIIITDSFHGCVIASILEKNFWAVKRHSDSSVNNMNSRLYTLFENMKIEDRFLENITNDKVMDKSIDYNSVNLSIDLLRQNSIKYLNNALNDCINK